jgi:hypothetical protein
MSLTKEYKEQEVHRQQEAKKSLDHYKRVNLPGDRTFEVNIDQIRDHIEELKKDSEIPLHVTSE